MNFLIFMERIRKIPFPSFLTLKCLNSSIILGEMVVSKNSTVIWFQVNTWNTQLLISIN